MGQLDVHRQSLCWKRRENGKKQGKRCFQGEFLGPTVDNPDYWRAKFRQFCEENGGDKSQGRVFNQPFEKYMDFLRLFERSEHFRAWVREEAENAASLLAAYRTTKSQEKEEKELSAKRKSEEDKAAKEEKKARRVAKKQADKAAKLAQKAEKAKAAAEAAQAAAVAAAAVAKETESSDADAAE